MADEPNPAAATATGQPPSAAPSSGEPAAGASPLTPPDSLLGKDPAAPAEEPKAGETGEAKKEEAPAGPPEKYELTAPETISLSDEQKASFEGIARELRLTNEGAQKLLDYAGTELKAALEQPYRHWFDTQKAWQDEIKADPEIGGQKLDASLANARRAMDAFGGPKLREALIYTGAGNNPEIVRFVVKVGEAIGDDNRFVSGQPPGAQPPSTLGEMARQMYPNMPQGSGA